MTPDQTNTVHVMLDLETMDTAETAAIVSVSAVAFKLEAGLFKSLGEFDLAVDLDTSVSSGGTMSADNVQWWLQQPEVSRNAVLTNTETLHFALHAFTNYLCDLRKANEPQHLLIWGNGADFDNLILASAYKRTGIPQPWNFRDNRCFRTLKNVFDWVPAPAFIGTPHIGIEDARHQALWLSMILKELELCRSKAR